MSKTKKKDKPAEPKKVKAAKPEKKAKPAAKTKSEPASILEAVLEAVPEVTAEISAPVIAAVSVKKPAKKAPAKKASIEITISLEEIGLRAYFLSEKRHQNGWPGDESSDWVEAERQLRAEAARPKRGAKK